MKNATLSLLVIAFMTNTLSAAAGARKPITAQPRQEVAVAAPVAAAPVAPAEPTELTIPDGTLVEVELKTNISSENVEEGDIVDFIVLQPVKVRGTTVIERGAPAKGRIMKVAKARRFGREGNFEWAMQDVVCIDGSRLPVRFTNQARGGSSGGKVAIAMAVTSLVSWPVAPLWGFKKGKTAVTPVGKRFEVFIHGDSAVALQ